jgi:hypothetical protein
VVCISVGYAATAVVYALANRRSSSAPTHSSAV